MPNEQERFRRMVEISQDWFWDFDEHANFTYVSPSVRGLLGFDPEELVGLNAFDLMDSDEAERVHSYFDPIAKRYLPFNNLVNINRHKDGHEVVLESSGTPIFDEEGQFRGYRGVDRDITKRKELEENYRRLANLTSDYVHCCTRSGKGPFRVQWVDGAVSSISGYRIDEVLTLGCFLPLVHPDDQQTVSDYLLSLVPGDRKSIEFRILTQQQGIRWVYEQSQCEAGKSEGELVLLGAVTDITDRKKAEADSQKREKLFRDFFESNPVPTIITSSSGNIHMINPAFSQASGFSVEDVIGKTSQELGFWRDLTDRERMVTAIREVGLINNLEASFYTKNNQQLTCLVSSRVIEYEGEPRILSTVLDVTEQRNAEGALRKIDQAKNDFIRIAAHELQTPLVAVLGYAELLENSSQLHANEQQKHYASIISTNAEILSRLVNDLLDVERIQLGRFLSIVRDNVSFAELIKKVTTSITPKCPEHRFILTHANSLPESICIDEGRIAQVLNNLLTNAVKFSPEGGIIEISTTTDESTVTTSVRDYGLGMTPEHVELVFDKFYRANPENPQISGLGLGMNIVKQIVEEHGGEISISSNLGEGTTVTFTLTLEDIASF